MCCVNPSCLKRTQSDEPSGKMAISMVGQLVQNIQTIQCQHNPMDCLRDHIEVARFFYKNEAMKNTHSEDLCADKGCTEVRELWYKRRNAMCEELQLPREQLKLAVQDLVMTKHLESISFI